MRAPLFARHACTLPALRMAQAPRMLLDPGVSSSLLALTSVDLLDVSSDATVASLMDEIAQAQLAAEKAIETKEIVESTLGGLGHDIMVFLAASVCVAPLGKALNLSPVLLYLVIGCAMGPFGFDLFPTATAFTDTHHDAHIPETSFDDTSFASHPHSPEELASFNKLGEEHIIAKPMAPGYAAPSDFMSVEAMENGPAAAQLGKIVEVMVFSWMVKCVC